MNKISSRRVFLRNTGLATIAGGLSLWPISSATGQTNSGFLTGVDALSADGFAALRGQRVGLLTNPAGVGRDGTSSIEILRRAPAVRLVALFGPEHGIYGDEKANVPIQDRTDPRTGLPVFSLYGQYRKPTPRMLRDIDTLVIDLQDVGCRSYTYISCMRYAMEACFEQGKKVVVLDRPNPIGGLKVDGPSLEREWMSYVGAFPVPYVHGLTIGEIARMAQMKPNVMAVPEDVRQRGQLQVIPMRGWRRDMMWTDTGLRWVPTSPAIPDLSAAMGYAMTGLGCQLGGFTHGYGTRYPFRLLQFRGKSPEAIAARLRQCRIRGLDFRVVHFEDRGRTHRGTYVMVTDWEHLRPTEISFHLMAIACEWSDGNPFAAATPAQRELFTKHVGEGGVMEALLAHGANFPIASFLRQWDQQNREFIRRKVRWHLYR